MAVERARRVAVGLAMAAALAWLAWHRPGPWEVALAVGMSVAFGVGSVRRAERVTVVLGIGVAAASVAYFTWRISVVNLSAWWISVPLAAAELFGGLHTLGLQYTIWPRREPVLTWDSDPAMLPVYVLVPTVDEGAAIVEQTVRGAMTAAHRYRELHRHAPPFTFVVCNDGLVAGSPTTADVQAMCRRLGVRCVTRTVGGGAKAGNLEHARDVLGIHGRVLLAIFDADQVAKPEFFLETIPPFADRTIGWVQTGQYYRNVEEPVARWAGDQQQIFYGLVCPGKCRQNSVFICGTNVVIRADALDEIGGMPRDSVTEDFAASLRLHGRWRSLYVEGVLATGLGPIDVGSYFKQQNRWARGTIGLLKEWRRIVGRGAFTLDQRIQYALSCTHYLSGLRDLAYVAGPVTFLLVGTPAVVGATLGDFITHFVPYLAVSQVAFWIQARGNTTWRGIVIGFASFPTLIAALTSVVLGRRSGGFVLTPKTRAGQSLRPVVPHLVCTSLVLTAVLLGLLRHADGRVSISLLWLLYTLAMFLTFLHLAVGDARPRYTRATRRILARLEPLRPRRVPMRPALAGPLVCVAAVAALLPRLHTASAAPTPFSGTLCAPGHVAVGMHAQGAELRAARGLVGRAPVIGTTIELRAGFPRDWADRVRAQGGTPWITLTFSTRGRATLASSLLAIGNGLHDAALAHFADDARRFGRTVLLTVLAAPDRNWAPSSGVANGGIPEDVAPAWSHIRALLSAQGARNVAMVWAPADPIDDQPYAPPASQIDVVQATWFGYRGAHWPDSRAVLAAIERRHPGKPVLIDISLAGPATRKYRELTEVVRAAARRGAVVVYHEGGPFLDRSAPGRREWSLTMLTRAQARAVVRAGGPSGACAPLGMR